ncbi:Icc-related predicted phosphoesterase [Spirosoma oryzae]|uniref:Icc-related predicted phosphoesterase n=1 Tax=Spirosoma oryzae TaxID=1469603 RepID=A0A2T0SYK3_9BACT|nr:metallophosphatase domain-containing protein [Spirosoma oryzae]PRY38488.1 Icc-related predicted phosphoesterase [Spirosoma oryzae]
MKIVCISDTHGFHNQFTQVINELEADVLIHAGDFTRHGTVQDCSSFLNWYAGFTHIPNKLFICGNHDEFPEKYPVLFDNLVAEFPEVTYLHHRQVTIDGVKFWGSNYSPAFWNWFWMVRRGEPSRILWDMIPEETNILVTHGPVHDILDETVDGIRAGCEALHERIADMNQLKLHVCGHIHEARGEGCWEIGNTVWKRFVNASLINEQYRPVHKPIIVEL